jgi:hypothetical protein
MVESHHNQNSAFAQSKAQPHNDLWPRVLPPPQKNVENMYLFVDFIFTIFNFPFGILHTTPFEA